MSTAKDFRETFKGYDQYVNAEISKREFNMRGVLKRSIPPMTKSEVDNIFIELGIRGEDRVFSTSNFALKFSDNRLRSSVSVKPEDVINTKLKKESGVTNLDSNKKKTKNQLQIPMKPLEEKEINEDWVLIETDDINDQ